MKSTLRRKLASSNPLISFTEVKEEPMFVASSRQNEGFQRSHRGTWKNSYGKGRKTNPLVKDVSISKSAR